MTEGSDGIEAAVEEQFLALIAMARQTGEYIARAREEALRRAQARNQQEAREIKARISAELRMARAEMANVHRPEWWAHAGPQDISRMYQIARSWSSADPEAARVQAALENRLAERGHYGRAEPRRASMEVPPEMGAGDERQQQSDAESLTAPQEKQKGVGVQSRADAPDAQGGSLGPDATPKPSAQTERDVAVQWFREHYGDSSQSPDRAYATFSALAAEGYDMKNPPPIHDLSVAPKDYFGSMSKTLKELRDLGMAGNSKIDHRALHPIGRAWELQAEGAYPALDDWGFHVHCKAAQSLEGVPAVSLQDEFHPGTYTSLLRSLAQPEAEAAGTDVVSYLDHLAPLHRRAILAESIVTTGYDDVIAQMKEYRIAYARESLRQRPEWALGKAERERAAVEKAEAVRLLSQVNQEQRADMVSSDSGRIRGAGEQHETVADRAHEDGRVLYDSAERRKSVAQELEARGVDPEIVATRVRADTSQAKPATDAVKNPSASRMPTARKVRGTLTQTQRSRLSR